MLDSDLGSRNISHWTSDFSDTVKLCATCKYLNSRYSAWLWSWKKVEIMPQPAWGQVKATHDECIPIAHNRPQNQFETPSMATWYIRLIWRNQFKVSLWWSDVWHVSWCGGWKRWNAHAVYLPFLLLPTLPFTQQEETPSKLDEQRWG